MPELHPAGIGIASYSCRTAETAAAHSTSAAALRAATGLAAATVAGYVSCSGCLYPGLHADAAIKASRSILDVGTGMDLRCRPAKLLLLSLLHVKERRAMLLQLLVASITARGRS